MLSAGVFRLNIFSFLTAVVIGRTIRYSIWGVLAVLYGNPVKRFMQQNLKEVGIAFLAAFALMSAVFVLYYVHRMKAPKIERDPGRFSRGRENLFKFPEFESQQALEAASIKTRRESKTLLLFVICICEWLLLFIDSCGFGLNSPD